MALLYELADYSLQSLIKVPSERACTSQLRKWGIPGDKESKKEPVMKTSIVTQDHKRGIQPTLYEARLNFNINDNKLKVIEMKEKLSKIDKNIGYSHVIPSNMKFSDEFTKFGTQFIGSPLSYQLLPLEENFKFITNINKVDKYSVITEEITMLDYDKVPLGVVNYNCEWEPLSSKEKQYMEKLFITMEGSFELEKATRRQRDCELWFEERKNRITSSNAHKIFIRKRNFETLVTSLYNKKNDFNNLPKMIQTALQHGIKNEIVAKEKYTKIMNFKLMRNILIEDVGLVIQPNIPWLGASPDGKVIDNFNVPSRGLIEVKCPYTKRDCDIFGLVENDDFYVGLDEKKKIHI